MGRKSPEPAAAAVLVVLAALAGVAAAGDIVHQDDKAPKIPGCSNDFVLVQPSCNRLARSFSSFHCFH